MVVMLDLSKNISCIFHCSISDFAWGDGRAGGPHYIHVHAVLLVVDYYIFITLIYICIYVQ